jgi:hypothetical protein
MGCLLLAFRCFLDVLFRDRLSDETAAALGLVPAASSTPTPPASAPADALMAAVAPEALTAAEAPADRAGTPPARPGAAPAPAGPSSREGALQLLAILQRDARLVDFLMEDISAYGDDQVGAAVRELHDQCRQSLLRYVRLVPVLDGVENARTTLPADRADPATVKFIGNVPAMQVPTGGILRHRGWRAEAIELPPVPREAAAVIAPAEIEVE